MTSPGIVSPARLLLKELSAAYFGFRQCGFLPTWQLFNNLVGDFAQLCRYGFFATGVACFSILRIAAFGLENLSSMR